MDDNSVEPKQSQMAEFRSIADPLTLLELAAKIEQRAPPDMHAELLQILREFVEYAEKQPCEKTQELVIKAKALL